MSTTLTEKPEEAVAVDQGDDRKLGTPPGLTGEQQLIYSRIPEQIDHVPNEAFDDPRAEQRFYSEQAEEIDIPTWTAFPEIADERMVRKAKRPKLKPHEEVELFLRYNYARRRLGELIEAQRRRVSAGRARCMILWFQRVMKARADLVRANLPLVLAMAKRTKIPNVDFGEVISEGNMALLRAVEKFDVARGFKFSTYACRAILKSFNRLATKTGRYHQRFPTEYDPEMEKSDFVERRHDSQREDNIDAVREILLQNRAHLSELERRVVMERFAITSRGKGHTLAEVGRMVGLTNERVRQIQNKALSKIRAAINEAA